MPCSKALGELADESYDGRMTGRPNSGRTHPTGRSKGSLAKRAVRLIIVLAVVAAASYFGIDLTGSSSQQGATSQPARTTDTHTAATSTDPGHDRIAELMRAQQADTMVTLSARIVRI